jgi:hypothetical protein
MADQSEKPYEFEKSGMAKRPSLPVPPLQGLKRTLSSKTTPDHQASKPLFKRPIIRAEIPSIDKATSADGEVFVVGDKVLVTELGQKTQGSIKSFYADAAGDIWAQVVPLESDQLCLWQQACIQSKFLAKNASI